MRKLGTKGSKLLKLLHIIFSSFWGGAVFFTFMGLIQCRNQSVEDVHGMLTGLLTLDLIAKPCMLGLIATGLIYSVFTGWSFKKHYWIIIKWIIALCLPFMGSLVFDTSLEKIIELSSIENFSVEAPEFVSALLNAQIAFGIGTSMFVLILFISVFKPFGRSVKVSVSKKI